MRLMARAVVREADEAEPSNGYHEVSVECIENLAAVLANQSTHPVSDGVREAAEVLVDVELDRRGKTEEIKEALAAVEDDDDAEALVVLGADMDALNVEFDKAFDALAAALALPVRVQGGAGYVCEKCEMQYDKPMDKCLNMAVVDPSKRGAASLGACGGKVYAALTAPGRDKADASSEASAADEEFKQVTTVYSDAGDGGRYTIERSGEFVVINGMMIEQSQVPKVAAALDRATNPSPTVSERGEASDA